MGKLYDRRDRDWEYQELDRMEAEISRFVVEGTIDPMVVPSLVEDFRKTRQACNMKLLKSGQLMRDLRAAERSFNRVPSESNKFRFSICKKAVYWAGKSNLERRAAANQLRPGDVLVESVTGADNRPANGRPEGDGFCNAWETWYLSDLKTGIWPGLTTDERRENELDYGLGYKGWLRMLRFHEEIEQTEFESELARLSEAAGEEQ